MTNKAIVPINDGKEKTRRIIGFSSFFIYFVILIALTIIAVSANVSEKNMIMAVAMPIVAALSTIALLYKKAWGSTKIADALFIHKISVKDGFLAASIGLGLFIGLQLISALITIAFNLKVGNSDTTNAVEQTSHYQRIIVMYIMVPFIVPFVEELFFRGFIFGTLVNSNFTGKKQIVIPALFSSIVFSFMHFQGFNNVTGFLVVGYILIIALINSYMLARKGSIIFTFIIHSVYNGIAMFISLLAYLAK